MSFNVVAAGTAPLSYQWRLNNTNILGATSSTLTLTGVTIGQSGGSYSCVVTNLAGSVTSSAAILTVSVATIAPAITTHPTSQTVTAGANVNFTVAASGTAPLSYRWRLNGANISGATAATLTLNSVTIGQSGGSYSCVVSNSAGTATSTAATLTVNSAVVAPTITTHPTGQTVTAGANVNFSVAASGTAPLSYQWRLNGGNISGATAATLTLNSVTVGQSGGSYSCVVSNSAGTATSTAATLTVNSAVVAPTITTHPTGQTVTAGANVNFSVAASGTAPLSYQWRLNGGNIVGATAATLTLNSVTVGQSGSSYSCVVSNSAGTATSTAATLTVSDVTQTASIAGVYNGLFYENDAVRLHSAGQFSLALNENKIFTAWLQIGGTRYSMIGTFNSALTATSVIVRSGANSLSVELRVGQGAEAGQIFGRVTDGVWSSPLSGGRSVSPSPFAGNYTLVIPGTAGNAALPAGDGYATLHVASDGLATMNGVLADGARFSQSAYVTEDGDWPLFAAIYSGKGVIASWIAFANLSTSDLNGTLLWIKEAGTSTTSFPLGFTNSVNSIGSFYVASSAGNKALNLSGAVVNFSGGSLGSGFNNVVSVNANSQVVNLSPNEMVMTVMNAVGSFTGQVREPGTGALHMYGGVVLQKQNAGYGTMTGVPTGSRVIFAAP